MATACGRYLAGRIDAPAILDALRATPDWAQPVVARAFAVFEG